jgi:predicted Zn-dependent peptidase
MQKASYQKSILENGITVVTETIPHLRSVTVGVWIKYGSADDPSLAGGISHFIEHLLFKGTEKRTAGDIADTIDSLGGQIDAFTSREYTCYYASVLDQHLQQALDLLIDMVFHTQFKPEDIEIERQVILEEIKEDNPEEYIHDLFSQEIWKDHPLGRPICGTNKSIRAMGTEQIDDSYRHVYRPENILIAAAGNLQHEDLIHPFQQVATGESSENGRKSNPVEITSHLLHRHRELEEVHVCLGTRGLEQTHPQRFAVYLLNGMLGSGVSSRLFQEIREKRGLAYSIYSYNDLYHDSGLLAAYAATAPASYLEVISLILKEFNTLKTRPISEQELKKAQQQLKINLLLGLESSMSRMNSLARNEFYFQRRITPDETIEEIKRVTAADIFQIAQEIFQPQFLNLVILSSPQLPILSKDILQC